MKAHFLFLALATLLTGCATYDYRLVQPPPPAGASIINREPVRVHVDPLDYQFEGRNRHLLMQISNPTDQRIALVSDRSYAVDPLGESHPIAGRMIGPHSYAQLSLPPVPVTFPYPAYGWGPLWGPGWGGVGWGWYDPLWGPSFGPAFIGPPPVTYYQVWTAYDWNWRPGRAHFHLLYDRQGKTFEHDFEIIREKRK